MLIFGCNTVARELHPTHRPLYGELPFLPVRVSSLPVFDLETVTARF